MTRLFTVIVASTIALAAGCGVSSEDEPQPIEDTSIQQPPVAPSVDTDPGPTRTTTRTTTSTTTTESLRPHQ